MAAPADRAKRTRGRFYTRGNPFALRPFANWARAVQLQDARILEPFAGANDIIRALQDLDLCRDFLSCDIAPASPEVQERDTLHSFPEGFDVCVTNPPWLARNSATRRGLRYPDTAHDDLYKHCLELCLAHCAHVAAIAPASYLHSGLFRERLASYILLHDAGMFDDTENPVCLALFGDAPRRETQVFYDNECIGVLDALERCAPVPHCDRQVRFNDPDGALGLIAFDDTKRPSIRFCKAEEIDRREIKVSSRFRTRISGEFDVTNAFIRRLNGTVDDFRERTQDLFLTPFKGIRNDGRYRRRMDFRMARKIINAN